MKFLTDVLGKSETCTNLASNIQNISEDEKIENKTIESPILESQPSCSNVSNTPLSSPVESGYFESSKKRKIDKQSRDEDLHEAVIAALQDTKKPDGLDGFLLLLSEGLRKLPYRERTKLQLKFFHMIMEE
ncbi:PREDICTED: uncharacterized protein LOC108773863 [Cyphomyrmex costatus]|uniref:BESS domain-containing protein n=1 Tax=Cyphomyrmex costatus TaxID=456900 RepID=A0A151IJ62_9HYME|nr:PREDICTED: uncharacterized protein LOC108773863 [Cyphomyrmex costatus]KYN02906.1 hypothetical protein ALC62_06305 [Cyphomyrmex costatus]